MRAVSAVKRNWRCIANAKNIWVCNVSPKNGQQTALHCKREKDPSGECRVLSGKG